jgi:hypothetical protein
MTPNSPLTVNLDHRAYHLLVAPCQSVCVAADSDGAMTIVDVGSGRAQSVTFPMPIRDIGIHPSQPLIAVIDEKAGKLYIVDFEGKRLFEQAAPRPRKKAEDWQRKGFEGCYFDQNENHFWSVARRSADKVEVELRETERWSVLSSILVEDPFEESSCSFHPTCKPDVIALWLAAGQNGQGVYWITKYPGWLAAELEPFLENTSPPVFAPEGNEFLVIDDVPTVCKYGFPTERKLGVCRSRWGDEDYFGDSLCYLDATNALVKSHHGRLFRIDLRAMKVADEIIFQDHEPRPVEEYYPSLAGEKALCTDIAYFARFGEIMVFGCHRETGAEREQWKDTLMFLDVKSYAARTH